MLKVSPRHKAFHFFSMQRQFHSLMTVSVLAGLLFISSAVRAAITICGSDTMLNLNREWIAEYAKIDPQTRIDVTSGGSGLGIAALLEGKADIAAASRSMSDKEIQHFKAKHGSAPREIIVAFDGIAVYVHNNNPVSQLTMDQLAGIMTGRIQSWKEVGGLNRQIHIYNRDINSGTRAFMQEHVLRDKPFSPNAREVASTSILTSCVARNQNAIGYGGIAYSQGAHIIRLSAVSGAPGQWPSHENVASGQYPLSRPLYFYVNPASNNSKMQDFIRWILSPAGQEVVTFIGFFPAPKETSSRPAAVPAPVQLVQSIEIPEPAVNAAPILLTPDNIKQHGFNMAVAFEKSGNQERPDNIRIQITFLPDGHSIERIRDINLFVGSQSDIVVPLTLSKERTVQLSLRKNLIDTSSISLAEEGAPQNGNTYSVQLKFFKPAD